MKQLKIHDIHDDLKRSIDEIHLHRTAISILCDQIEDARNVGSLFRLADAARLKELLFFNPTGLAISNKVNRIARQTVQYVPHRIISDLDALTDLQSSHEFVALEYTNESIPYTTFETSAPIVLIIGNEQTGISPALLQWANKSIHLPMLGINSSMNVSMATGIAVYGLLNKIKPL